METTAKIKNLTKSFNQFTVVDGISFEVHKGECLGILGPNGAGKTTTLRMLLGLTRPDSGEIEVLGYKLPQDAKAMRKRVGVVPQLDNLDPDFSVEENLRTYASYFGMKGAQLNGRIHELLEFASLKERARSNVEALSGGMKRRLTLARSLINNPDLLVLDEPSTGLDPQARQMIWQRLRSLLNAGRTLIITTHYMEEAQRLCDRILLIDQGEILDVGKPSDLINKHIETHVFEVHGLGVDEWESDCKNLPLARYEKVGETLFCYSNDDKCIVDSLLARDNIEFLHRRANLEDVFLKLTGRDLRDD